MFIARHSRLVVSGVGVILALSIAIVTAVLISANSRPEPTVVVPNLIGKTSAALQAIDYGPDGPIISTGILNTGYKMSDFLTGKCIITRLDPIPGTKVVGKAVITAFLTC